MTKKRDVAAGSRRPYLRPRIDTEEVFETLALACCKVNGAGCQVASPIAVPTVSVNAS